MLTTQMSSQQVSYLGSSSNYVTLLLSGTLIKHGVNEVLTDKKEGANKKTPNRFKPNAKNFRRNLRLSRNN